MILEYGRKQHECLHQGWEKVADVYEEYWRCTNCGATNETPTGGKTQPTPLPKSQEDVS